MTRLLGYEFLRTRFKTGAFRDGTYVCVGSSRRIERYERHIEIPVRLAPAGDSILEHLDFALRHEALQLQSVMLALKQVDYANMSEWVRTHPNSVNTRVLGFWWEVQHGKTLPDVQVTTGYAPIFDPDKFVTTKGIKVPKWRLVFNGLGIFEYCPVVRRTEELEMLLKQNTLEAATEFTKELEPAMLERAVQWAYLSETNSSYAIEHEELPKSKADAFVKLLSHAHLPIDISEQYLCELQRIVVDRVPDQARAFRTTQNWLHNSGHGAQGVTYVPPPPRHVTSLMNHIMHMANQASKTDVDPILLGSIISFGFVHVHPFHDGNGRLSRFLFHKVVGDSDQLKDGLVLPISIAMKRNEKQYLAALQSFAGRTRDLWEIDWQSHEKIHFKFNGEPEIFQYWDATEAAIFGLSMAKEALDVDLRGETGYLHRMDALRRAVDKAVNLKNPDVASMVEQALRNNGVLSKKSWKYWLKKNVSEQTLMDAQVAIAEVYECDAGLARSTRVMQLEAMDTDGLGGLLQEEVLLALSLSDQDSVRWTQVHVNVVSEALEKGFDGSTIVETLAKYSPGVTTDASLAWLRRMVDTITKEYVADKDAPTGPT